MKGNRTGKGQFGKDKDPVANGKKGAEVTNNSTRLAMIKRLKEIQKLPYEEYMAQLRSINPSLAEPDYLSTVLLSGEKGYDSYLQKLLETDSYLANKEMANYNSEKQQREVVKDLIRDAGYVKTLLYGAKQRSEIKVEEKGKIDLLFEELVKDDGKGD